MGSWGYFEYPTEPRWRRLGEESWEERDEKIAKELEWEAWPDYEELIAREDGAVMDGCDGACLD